MTENSIDMASDAAATTSQKAQLSKRRDAEALINDQAASVKVIFSDLDGTLLLPDGSLPRDFHQAVRKLTATGVHFVAATGRTLWSACEVLGESPDRLDIVAGNGMDVILNGKTVRHLSYARADLEELLACVRADPARPGLMAYDNTRPYLLNMDPSLLAVWSLHNSEQPHIACTDELPAGELVKVALIARDNINEVVAHYAQRFDGRLSFAACGQHWIDIPLPGAGKGEGVRIVLNALGATPKEAIAFGDSMNDEGLMASVRASVAVSNALPALKRECVYEIGSNAQASVVRAIELIAARRVKLFSQV